MRSNGARGRDDDATTRPRDGAGARRRAPEGDFFERRARDVLEDGRASFEAVNRASVCFYRAFVALMGTRRRERAREGTAAANGGARAREKGGGLTDECRRGSRANPRRRYTPRT